MVQPATLIRWHGQGFRLLWRWKSKPGRPALPQDLQALIRRMALENPMWGQERIANELLLKLGLRVLPRTVRNYTPGHCVGGPGKGCPSQRWATFIRNHAKDIVACDFCVAVTATFCVLYVFVVIDHSSRQLLHVNVTAHPTAQWTMQQFREAIPADHPYRLLLHDRDAIFSKEVDQGVRNLGLRVIQTPVRTPVVNGVCERVIGTLRRECLDLRDSRERAASLRHLKGMGGPLQRRSSPHVTGTGHPVSAASLYAYYTPPTSAPAVAGLLSRCEVNSWWIAS